MSALNTCEKCGITLECLDFWALCSECDPNFVHKEIEVFGTINGVNFDSFTEFRLKTDNKIKTSFDLANPGHDKTVAQCSACNQLVEYDINMKVICSYCQTEELAREVLDKEKNEV